MRDIRARQRLTAHRRSFGLALALLSVLTLGGWSDCCCCYSPALRRVEPYGYGNHQPFRAEALELTYVKLREPVAYEGVGAPGTRPALLYQDKWIKAEEPLRIDGRVASVKAVLQMSGAPDQTIIGSDMGLHILHSKTGSLRAFAGISAGGVSTLVAIEQSTTRFIAGIYSVPFIGTPLLYACSVTTVTCTVAIGSNISTKVGDGVTDLRAFGVLRYSVSTIGLISSPDGGEHWFNESGLPVGSYNRIAGEDGNLIVTGPGGNWFGMGRGGIWTKDPSGPGTDCRGIAFIAAVFYMACNVSTPQVYLRAARGTTWTSTALAESLFVGGLENYNNRLVLGTSKGAKIYQNSIWEWLDDCFHRPTPVSSIAFSSGTLYAGGGGYGAAFSTNNARKWSFIESANKLSVFQWAFRNQDTYFTGTSGTYAQLGGQGDFQRVTLPTTAAQSLGQAGGAVFAGLSSGGIGTLTGTTFTASNTGFDTTAAVNGFAGQGAAIVALTNKGNFFAANAASPSWAKGANRADGQPFVGYSGTALPDGNLLLGGYANPSGWNVAISNPSGTVLTKAGVGIPDGSIVYSVAAASITPSARDEDGFVATAVTASTSLFAATSNGLYASFDGAASWSLLSQELGTAPAYSVGVNGNRLWVGTRDHGLTSYSLPIRFRRLVPIVLDVTTAAAHFTTELVLTNRGAGAADVSLQYTAAGSLGGTGSGTVSDTLAAGTQLVISDVLAYLRQKGLAIPVGGAQGGTLLLTFANVSAAGLPSVTARTTAATGAPFPVGRAGLAYGAIDPEEGTGGSLTVYGLRTNAADRSNLAVFNTSNQDVTVKVTAYSGAGDGASLVVAAADTLPAWGWKQYNRVLEGAAGYAQGWVTVERTSTDGSFSIYGVINDNPTNDGSLVLPASNPTAPSYTNVPVLVETGGFVSELVLANSDTVAAIFHLVYTESLTGTGGGSADVTVAPKTQLVIPNAIDYLRTHGVPIGAAGAAYAGSLHVDVSGAAPINTYVGARTSAPAAAGGEFGVFTPAFTPGTEADLEATINGLRSDSENRSNVAVANTGGANDGSVTLSIQAYDGDAAGVAKGAPTVVALPPGRWQQFNNFLAGAGVTNGWVKVTRTAGSAPWIAYGVVNDGGAPGQRTGDGAYVPMVK